MSSGSELIRINTVEDTNDDNEEEILDYSNNHWAKNGNQYCAIGEPIERLEAGIYCLNEEIDGIKFVNFDIETDELISIPNSDAEEVLECIADFWTKEEIYKELKFLWKRGIILHGPPGSGKTSIVNMLIKDLIEQDGVIFYCDSPNILIDGLTIFRDIEPSRPLIVIIEDLDTLISRYGEHEILSLLDGETQTSNVVYIATTNYPEHLQSRIINRPGRFDIVKEIPMPNKDIRRAYLTHKVTHNLSKTEIEGIVNLTDGFSVAHLKELLLRVICFGSPIDETVNDLREMMKENSSSSNYNI